MEEIEIRTRARNELVDISAQVQALLRKYPETRLCTVYVPHTTAGVTINENADPDVKRDILMGLEKIVSETWPYRHSEGNSPSHIKASLMGSSVSIPVAGGRLKLGTWQAIYLAEFDGPRMRRICVQMI